MAPEIQSIQKRIHEWFKTETGKKYRNSSPQELIFALEKNNVLTPAEITSLKTHSLFLFGKKAEMSEALPLEGWGIERENKNPKILQTKQDNSETTKALEQRLNKVKTDLDSKVKENRFLRSAWHGIKNAIGFGANSKKVEKALEIERKKISQINKPEVFKELTGAEYTKDNYEKFIRGEIKLKSEQALEAYKQGQDGVVDFAADMVSGVAAVFIYSAAVAAAPFTGGLSVAAGFGAAVVAGAAIKTGLKAGANALSGKEYTKKDFKHDAITGGVSGALGPFTGGVGGAFGKSVATKLGIQALKEGVKDITVSGAKTGVKKWLMTAFTNPTGYKYVGGNFAKRAAAFGAEAMTDGALGGALDGGFRAGYENDWDGEAILEGTVQGGAGGAVMAPAIGGGMKLTGKAGHGLGARIKKFFGWGKGTKQVGETLADEIDDTNVKSSTTSWLVSMRQRKVLHDYKRYNSYEPNEWTKNFINLTVSKNPKVAKRKSIYKIFLDTIIFNKDEAKMMDKISDFIDAFFPSERHTNLSEIAARLDPNRNLLTNLAEPLSEIASKFGEGESLYCIDHMLYSLISNLEKSEGSVGKISQEYFEKYIKAIADSNLSAKQLNILFNQEKNCSSFDKIINILPELHNLDNKQLSYIYDFLAFEKKSDNLKQSEKKALLQTLESIPLEVRENLQKQGFDIINIEKRLKMEVILKGFEILTDPKLQTKFLRSYIGHEKEPLFKSTEFSNYLKTNSERGLPLKYSRKSFVSELNDLLIQLPKEEKDKVLKQLNIELTEDSFTGFVKWNGIDIESFPKNLYSIIESIQNKAKAFSADNEIVCDNPEIKSVLDDLVQGFPEFTSIIGKNNPGHGNTIDIHTLEVLNNAIQHPEYANLSDSDKTILKLSILMHEIGETMPQRTIYASSILDKFNFPQEIKERIVNLVRYNNFPNETAFQFDFRTKNDRLMAIILKSSKEKSISGNYPDMTKYYDSKTWWNLKPNFANNNFLVMAKNLPKKKFKLPNGKSIEISVLKMSEFKPETDMTKYGFPDKKFKDIFVQVHGCDIEDLEYVIDGYQNPLRELTISTMIKRFPDIEKNGYGTIKVLLTTSKMNRGGGGLYDVYHPYEGWGSGLMGRDFGQFMESGKAHDFLPENLNPKFGEVDYPEQLKDANLIKEYKSIQEKCSSGSSELHAFKPKPWAISLKEGQITPELIDIIYENNLFLIIR